jgi:hypothetical protein
MKSHQGARLPALLAATHVTGMVAGYKNIEKSFFGKTCQAMNNVQRRHNHSSIQE